MPNVICCPGVCDEGSGNWLVGVTGFEPMASSSRTKRATKLRHTPMVLRKTTSRSWWGQSGYPYRGMSVSREASGRQANRIGAVGWVPIPAETCNQDVPAQRCSPRAM